VLEQTYTGKESGKLCRPFQSAAQVYCRGYSLRLQRVITDFGADHAFGRVAEKIQEHYGINIPAGAIAPITEHHAHAMTEADMTPEPRPARGALTLIAEADGSMIPVVQTGNPDTEDESQDRRKTRRVFWKEAKLTLVRRSDEITPLFAVTLGDAVAAGADLKRLAVAAGLNAQTRVHGLGDGAPWIADQVEWQFGAQGSYLVDFYHLCDYLDAAKVCASNDPEWVSRQKERLKSNQLPAVMATLAPFQEPETMPVEQTPVRNCYRYLANRPDQFNYQAAILANLPIGSGEVESAHRYIIQERLKIPGAWWKPEHAQAMLNLRTTRANGGWNRYWNALAA
jgi:hypothetical protein